MLPPMWNGEAFQAKREQAGVTRPELAARLLVSQMAIYRWERGRTPHAVFRRALEDALDALIAERAAGNGR